MVDPKVVLLDEPSMGLDPKATSTVFEQVVRMRDAGTAVLLVEQNARRALETADIGCVLDLGRVHISGPAGSCSPIRSSASSTSAGAPPSHLDPANPHNGSRSSARRDASQSRATRTRGARIETRRGRALVAAAVLAGAAAPARRPAAAARATSTRPCDRPGRLLRLRPPGARRPGAGARTRAARGTEIELVNGGAAMRVRDRAYRGSRRSLQTRQVDPAGDGNDDWKAGI